MLTARKKRIPDLRLDLNVGQVLSKCIGGQARNYVVAQVTNIGTARLIPLSDTGQLLYDKCLMVGPKGISQYGNNALLESMLRNTNEQPEVA